MIFFFLMYVTVEKKFWSNYKYVNRWLNMNISYKNLHIGTSGNIWLNIWPDMVIHGYIKSYMLISGHKWLHTATLDHI